MFITKKRLRTEEDRKICHSHRAHDNLRHRRNDACWRSFAPASAHWLLRFHGDLDLTLRLGGYQWAWTAQMKFSLSAGPSSR